MNSIKYKKDFKFQLDKNYVCQTPICPKETIKLDYIELTDTGMLTLSRGYACDGPSFPAIQTKNFMRGGFVHDAFYQLMREGRLDSKIYRDKADRLLQIMCVEDGMCKIRAWWVYTGVKLFAKFASDPSNKKRVIKAP